MTQPKYEMKASEYFSDSESAMRLNHCDSRVTCTLCIIIIVGALRC